MSEPDGQGRATREAADWLARLNSRSVSTDELNAFYEWRRDPENAAAYARGEQLWHDARSLGDDREIAEAVKEALERPRLDPSRERGVGRRTVMAGGIALAASAGFGWFVYSRADHYRTAMGEQLNVRLADGSRIRLNTDSEVAVRLDRGRREVTLERGQAYFEVARDAARPFIVQAASLGVRALGTRFDVRVLADEPPRVLLVEGRVEVVPEQGEWRRELAAPGEALILPARGAPELARLDLEAATSWTMGRLVFRNTPIEAAIAEANRYSRVQIVLDAPSLRDLQVDGTFETGDPDALVSALTALFPLRAQRGAQNRIVLTRT